MRNGQTARPSTQFVPGGQFIAEHGLIVSEISARKAKDKPIVVKNVVSILSLAH